MSSQGARAYLSGLGLQAPPMAPRERPAPAPRPVHTPSGPWVGVSADELVWWRREGRLSLMARELGRDGDRVTLWLGMEDRTVEVPASEVESHAAMRRRRDQQESAARLAQARSASAWKMREPMSAEERERRRAAAQAEDRRRDHERDRRLAALESELATVKAQLARLTRG